MNPEPLIAKSQTLVQEMNDRMAISEPVRKIEPIRSEVDKGTGENPLTRIRKDLAHLFHEKDNLRERQSELQDVIYAKVAEVLQCEYQSAGPEVKEVLLRVNEKLNFV